VIHFTSEKHATLKAKEHKPYTVSPARALEEGRRLQQGQEEGKGVGAEEIYVEWV